MALKKNAANFTPLNLQAQIFAPWPAFRAFFELSKKLISTIKIKVTDQKINTAKNKYFVQIQFNCRPKSIFTDQKRINY